MKFSSSASTGLLHEPIPANVAHCHSLSLLLEGTDEIEETKKKIVHLIKLSDPVSLKLNLMCGQMFVDECLSTISQMENFTRLELKFDLSHNGDVFHIGEDYAKKLTVLHVGGGKLSSIDRLTSLVELKLEDVKMSEKELLNITPLPRLKILRLRLVAEGRTNQTKPNQGDEYGDDFVSSFSILSSRLVAHVEELDLSHYRVPYGFDLCNLKQLGQLTKLNLKNKGLTDVALELISGLTKLIELNISCNVITDSGLKHLANLTKLEKLNISHTDITDVGIEYIVHLRNLKVLDLNGTNVNWSKFHQPKDHPVTRLFAAGCFIYRYNRTSKFFYRKRVALTVSQGIS